MRWPLWSPAPDDTIDVVAVGGRPWMIRLQAPLHQWSGPARARRGRRLGRQLATACCRGCWPSGHGGRSGAEDASVMTRLAHVRRPRDVPGPSRSVGVGLGDGEGDAVDVLVQSAGVGAGVGTKGAVGLLGAALQDIKAVIE